MRLKFTLAMIILLISGALTMGGLKVSSASVGFGGSRLIESVNVYVNCTTANVSVSNIVMSNETALVHFPEEADMDNTALINATAVNLGFTKEFSILQFTFQSMDEVAAKSNADAVKSTLETAFGITFSWNSTGTYNSYVNVTYTGDGIANLTDYTQWLMTQCLNQTIEGFAAAFMGMVARPSAMTSIFAIKDAGAFNWTYGMAVHYTTSIPPGANSHMIDILDLLSVYSLAPSSYAKNEELGFYASMVMVVVVSNETINFEGCSPSRATFPMSRGWYVPSESGTSLMGTFYFGNDGTAVFDLSFTFSGVVIPEFIKILPLIALLSITTVILLRKRKKA